MLSRVSVELINHDPKHNILLSVHAYWADYDGTSEIQNAVNVNLPIVFGEIANKQANAWMSVILTLMARIKTIPPRQGSRIKACLLL